MLSISQIDTGIKNSYAIVSKLERRIDVKRIAPLSIVLLSIIFISGCGTTPHYPTDKQWARTPILKSDSKTLKVQGNFQSDLNRFLTATKALKENMTTEEVRNLGFDPDLKNDPCNAIGWLEASQLLLGNSVISSASIEETMQKRKKYTAIRCQATDAKTRGDRLFTYVNNKDTYSKIDDYVLVVIFSDNKVVAVDLSKRNEKSHDRQSSFLQVFGEFINTPKIDTGLEKLIPYHP